MCKTQCTFSHYFCNCTNVTIQTLDLEGSDRYGILTQVEEMGLGSVSEKRILITQSEWQSYNCGSMFAYVAHGDFNR